MSCAGLRQGSELALSMPASVSMGRATCSNCNFIWGTWSFVCANGMGWFSDNDQCQAFSHQQSVPFGLKGFFFFFFFFESCLYTENAERSAFCFSSICHNFYLEKEDLPLIYYILLNVFAPQTLY